MKVIAIFDVGKTNKKLLLFDEQYRIIAEQSVTLEPARDEDGDACEDLRLLTRWVRDSLELVLCRPDLRVAAVNFSAYGASFVHIGENGRPVAPLYNYLKPYPEALSKKLYGRYGGEVTVSMLTASPVLGSLNSGMQLYRLKEEQPALLQRIRYSLHLPQFLSYLVTGKFVSELTSIGCHTQLWNYSQQQYHEWVYREGIADKLAPIVDSASVYPLATRGGAVAGIGAVAGVGLHDSSAAIIPYLEGFRDPFVLISTGTWCISMNPFNDSPLTAAELQQDCLCYMSYRGKAIKASRLFAGHDHEQQVRRLAEYFQRSPATAAVVRFDPSLAEQLRGRRGKVAAGTAVPVTASAFGQRELAGFASFEEAYHCLMLDIMDQQVISTRLVLRDTGVRRIFVDGGFGRNQVFMHLLAASFPETEVFAASMPQATAIGAALAIHRHWNDGPIPAELIELKYYQ